jgi:hypothetical protein
MERDQNGSMQATGAERCKLGTGNKSEGRTTRSVLRTKHNRFPVVAAKEVCWYTKVKMGRREKATTRCEPENQACQKSGSKLVHSPSLTIPRFCTM